MKLSVLAKKAAALPDCEAFSWTGIEQYSDYNFDKATETHEDVVKYIDELRKRMASYAMALQELGEGYRQLRDLILEADVES